jgi:hypothetical protein
MKKYLASFILLGIVSVYSVSPTLKAYVISHVTGKAISTLPAIKDPYAINGSTTTTVISKKPLTHANFVATQDFTKPLPLHSEVEVNFDLPVGVKIDNSKFDFKYTGVELAKNIADKKLSAMNNLTDNIMKDGLSLEVKVSL